MEFLNFVFSPPVLLVMIGGILSAILSYLSASKTEKSLKYLSVGALLASSIVILGGIISGFSDYKKSKLIELKTNQILKLSKVNSDLGLQIADLSKKNQELNEFSINSITGGDSFCYYQLGRDPGAHGNYLLRMLMHAGKFPLFDLTIRIVDSHKLSTALGSNKEFDLQKIKSAEEIIHKETYFKAGQGNIYEHIPERFYLPENTNETNYSIFFTARNGNWHQQIKLRKISDKWIWATKVTKDKIVLGQDISPDYPKDKNGEVAW